MSCQRLQCQHALIDRVLHQNFSNYDLLKVLGPSLQISRSFFLFEELDYDDDNNNGDEEDVKDGAGDDNDKIGAHMQYLPERPIKNFLSSKTFLHRLFLLLSLLSSINTIKD